MFSRSHTIDESVKLGTIPNKTSRRVYLSTDIITTDSSRPARYRQITWGSVGVEMDFQIVIMRDIKFICRI